MTMHILSLVIGSSHRIANELVNDRKLMNRLTWTRRCVFSIDLGRRLQIANDSKLLSAGTFCIMEDQQPTARHATQNKIGNEIIN